MFMWALLLLDCLFWGVVAPPLAWLIFPLLRLIAAACPPSPTFGIKVHTPWDMLLHGYLSMHSIRIIDADGEHGLFVKPMRISNLPTRAAPIDAASSLCRTWHRCRTLQR